MAGNVRALLAQHATRYALQAAHQTGNRHLGWIFHKKMHVIAFAVHFLERCFKIPADPRKVIAKPIDGIAIKHLATIFRHEESG